jgi:hypothetical protein
MLGFLGRFGRARELRDLDDALRAVDLHPAMVADAVELAAVRLMAAEKPALNPADHAAAAELLAYCIVGEEAFAAANDAALADAVAARIERAVEIGDDLDARLVLLLMHAGIVQPSVVERFGLVVD